ncbi:hypothetical protein QM012_006175 [Aureobasidium pullulans]|uniref:Uncharacterized protein n=1 Tax=Aureobasidium pullulans TaxID=5580 RepID=A0ABR0TS67_AURPU
MSNAMTFAAVPAREDCPSCPETGERCALHQSMYLRAFEGRQEPDAMGRTDQASVPERGGHDDQPINEQPKMSKSMSKTLAKTLAREKNQLKTQEGQMISALRKLNFEEVAVKQKRRDRRREKAALQIPDPIKIANKKEKAAQRAADPERIAKLEAHKQKVAESKVRTQARRVRQMEQQKQHSKSRIVKDDIAEANEALKHAPALQSYRTRNDYVSTDPTTRTRGQNAARDVHEKIQSLVAVHSMPEETGADAFLVRADSLIDQILASFSSTLSTTDRKNLEEALSLVRTVQLLSSKDYRPQRPGTGDEWLDRVICGINPGEQVAFKRELAIEDVPIKQEYESENSLNAQEQGQGFGGRLRGGADNDQDHPHIGDTKRDTMMD